MRDKVNHEDFVQLARSARGHFLSDLLPKVKTPTLLLSYRNAAVPTTLPSARKIAAAIPGAEFVMLEGHRISDILCSPSGGIPPVVPVINDFLARLPGSGSNGYHSPNGGGSGLLSPRETEVLRLMAAGRSNPQIAEALVISRNTVQRHVSNILAKTGLANRTEAASFATRHGLD
jgi:DNA-binding CsgD family transcriptional regulator